MMKTVCKIYKEEIINGREVMHEGSIRCWACVGNRYYQFSKALICRNTKTICDRLQCLCAPAVDSKYQKRIYGLLLDGINIHIDVPRLAYENRSFLEKALY
jgi:magnesium chelatase subunit ChlI-like protein